MYDDKGVDLTGLLEGGHKRRLGVWRTEVCSGVQGQSPVEGLGALHKYWGTCPPVPWIDAPVYTLIVRCLM